MPTVSIVAAAGSAAKREGQPGIVTRFTFFVELDQAAASTRSVRWAVTGSGTMPASASDFVDGVLPSGMAVFAPGALSASIAIDIAGDLMFEVDESLTVTLSGASSGLTLGTSKVTALIENDDFAAHADAYVLLEGETLSAPAASGVLVNDEVEAGAVASLREPARHGGVELRADGSLAYVPLAGFAGLDSLTYRASNADGTTEAATVSIHVVPVSGGATLDLTSLTAAEQIAAIYVAFFGRAADAGGHGFWVTEFEAVRTPPQSPKQLFANIASSFGVSAEARALYPFLADPSPARDADIGSFLEQVYQNLFGRPPDGGGLAYWIGEVRSRLAAGEFVGSVLVDIIGGAQDTAVGQDITTLMSKVAVSLHYVAEQQKYRTEWTWADDLAEARLLLGGVSAGRQSLLGGMAMAETLVRADASGAPNRPAIVTGTGTGSVMEKGGVQNGAAGVATATGDLDAVDPDGGPSFVVQTNAATGHGMFSIASTGAWSFTLADADASVQGLNDGDTLTERARAATSDGTAAWVTITIQGRNDAAVLSSGAAKLIESNAAVTASGTLSISDVDSPATFVAQAATVGTYGTFTIDAAGTWSWAARSAHDAFVGGTTYTDAFVVTSADGTTTAVSVDIVGTNDAAVLASPVAKLIETNAVLSAGGTVTINDVDSPATFVAQAATAGTYGTFAIDAAGAWSWTASSAHDAFVGGTTYTDAFVVTSADGTTTAVTVDIMGTNDKAVLSSPAANLVETNVVLSTGGTVTISDVDSLATFVAQAATVGTYGTFKIDAAGAWSWTASSAHDAFVSGMTYTDAFVVTSADGTTTSVTVNIVGTNDAAVLSSPVANLVETNAALSTGGIVTIGDADSPATFVAQAATAGTYGTFKVDAAGAWSWTASSAHDAFVVGTTYADTFMVASADGTTTSVTVNIVGANDAAVLSSPVVNLVETNVELSTGGTVAIGDVDSPATFVTQAATAGTYGMFKVDAAGAWSWTANSAHDAFVGGTTYTDTFMVASTDGTTTSVTVNVLGTNDAAVLSSPVASLVETNAALSTGGTVAIGDVDSPATFVPQAAAGSYGAFKIDAAGAWSWTASSAHDAFVGGTTYADTFVVTSADGATTSVTVNVLGTNDAAALSSPEVSLVETNAALSTGGIVAIGDVDSPATFVPQAATAGTYGTFTIDAAGMWSWTASSAHDAFVDGTTYADTFVVTSADGTTTSVTVEILGTDDLVVITGTVTGAVVEDFRLAATGNLDAGAATFVVQTAVATTYGTFSIAADGAWDYALDNAGAAVQALAGGTTVHDLVTVATADGTTGVIDIAVTGQHESTVDLTFLSSAKGFIIQGDAAGDFAGYSVSSAGDVNGDGYADLIVGVPTAAGDGGGLAGEAYVVFGRASGLGAVDGSGRAVIDLTGLSPSAGFVVQGDAADDNAGHSVSSAGDLNGDGFADLIIGAPLGDDGGVDAGEAYVVFGRASGFGTVDGSGRAVIDLTSLSPSAGFIVQGDAAADEAGFSVSSAGDVNGDGYADLVVGARFGDDGGRGAGEAYVVFGRASGLGTVDGSGRAVIDLTSLSPSAGFIIWGDLPSDSAGHSVSSAGDVNGDGYADLIVGAIGSDDGGSDAGEADVVFGRASGFGTVDGSGRAVIDLAGLFPSVGFTIRGDLQSDNAGYSVSSAGDVNGDGYADLIVGAIGGDDGGSDAGEAYVVFGRASGFGTVIVSRPVIDLSSLAPSAGFIIQGDAAFDRAGYGVSSAGDVNGDGYADLIVGAIGGDDGGIDAGEAYVVFGRASGFGTVDGSGRAAIDLSNLAPSDGFIVQGAAGDEAGHGVSSAGDVNGDGYADLIVGAPSGGDGESPAGEAYVLFGGPFGGSMAPVTTTGSGAAEILVGGRGNDTLIGGGGADSIRGGAGDDTLSIADLAFRSIDGGTGSDTLVLAGASLHVRAAKITGIERFDLTGTGDNTLAIDPLAVLNWTLAAGGGTRVVTVEGNAGDAVSLSNALWANAGTAVEGAITFDRYIAGNAEVRIEQGLTVRQTIDLTSLAPSAGFIVQGAEPDHAGHSVSSAGDVNGDGYADLIVGAWLGGDSANGFYNGEAYVVFGGASGLGEMNVSGRTVIDLATLSPSAGFVVKGDALDDRAGWSVSSAGDVNGDGFADVIVGAPYGDDGGIAAGEAYVVFGRASGLGTADVTGRAVIDLTFLAASAGFIVRGDAAEDFAGWSVSSAGDLNGDGFADIIVGAIGGDDGAFSAGEAYVVFGRASGLGTADARGRAVIDLSSLAPSAGFIVQGDAEHDGVGQSVSSAGDVNGDGFADLIVGADGGDDGGRNAGEAYVVFGRESGFGTVDGSGRSVIVPTGLAPSDGFIVQGDAAGDSAGWSVSSAGDVNGDGYADLIVGALLGNDGGTMAGEAYVVFGRASSLGTVDGRGRSVIDLTSLAPSAGFIVQGDAADDWAGYSVSSAGDINGDGFADLIVGAYHGDDGGADAGEAYVMFGRASGFGTVDASGRAVIDLTSLAPSDGFIVQGDAAGDSAGWSVSSAGDVNGDGYADLLVGSPSGDDGGDDAGEAYVLFGGAFGGSTTPVMTISTGAAEILIGGRGNDTLTGGGGGDSIRGGAGDDAISVPDLAFLGIDGGGGSDTLFLLGAGQSFDLTTLADTRIVSIERIDVTGSGDNSLKLGLRDVLHLSDVVDAAFTAVTSGRALVVDGNAGDTLDLVDYDGAGALPLSSWQLQAVDVGLDGSAGGAYDLYQLTVSGVKVATVAVDVDMAVI